MYTVSAAGYLTYGSGCAGGNPCCRSCMKEGGGGGAEGKREQEQEGLEEVVEARMCWCRNRT